MHEIKVKFQPKQKLFKETIDSCPVTLFGGARGGGKSYALRNIFLARRFEFPKSNGVIFRRTFPELEANHIRPLFQEHPILRQFWNESKKLLTLPNQSTLQFSHCANERDIALQQGREIHDLGIDEAGGWPEGMFRTIQGSNRSSSPNIPAKTALTANPGGIGHAWLKRLFIERRYNERERPQDYKFIQSLIQDNPALIESDPDYVYRLQTEPNEALRKAFLYGDWNIFAGQFFQEITKEVHMVKPFSIPPHWNRFGAYDYGFNHPAAFGWFANDEDGNTYLYREFIQAQLRVDQFAKHLSSYADTAQLYPIVAGHDCWTQKNVLKDTGQPPTVAEEFLAHGINLSRAVIDRVQGAAQLRSYLAWQGKPNLKPRLFIFENCPVSFDTISRMVHDPDKVEDVLKVDATEGDPYSGDDAYEMCRYGLMSRPAITDPIKPKLVMGTAAWHKDQNDRAWEIEREKLEKEEGMETFSLDLTTFPKF
jgi:phage terminase large subunit